MRLLGASSQCPIGWNKNSVQRGRGSKTHGKPNTDDCTILDPRWGTDEVSLVW